MGEGGEDRGFKVVDKRSFLDEDEPAAEPEEAGAGPGGEARGAEPAPGGRDDEPDSDEPLPEVDFVTFVLSLHNSASCLLGNAPYPDTGQCAVNLPLAKQTIDILGMLQDRTRGNLSGEEERILGEVLYDLRMAYVQAARK